MTLRLVTMLALIVLLPALAAEARSARADDRVRAEAWRQDIRALVDGIAARHVNPFTRVSKEDFESAASELATRVPELSDMQIRVALMQLAARIGDSHTMIADGGTLPPFGRYPLQLVRLGDGYFVSSATESSRALLGGRLLSIGAMDVEEVVARISTVYPHENEPTRVRWACRWIVVPEVLHAVGVVENPESVEVVGESADGERRRVVVQPLSGEVTWVSASAEVRVARPSLQLPRTTNYWFEHLPELQTVYVRYDRCAADPTLPIRDFSRQLLTVVDRNDVRRVIVDLRANGGGDSAVFRPVIRGLSRRRDLRQPGGVLVLIGPGTFSSAMLNALDLKNGANAVLIGTPTGQKPNAFGEVRTLTLPNSGITVNYSTKRFEMVRGDDPPSLMPDVIVEPRSRDVFSGYDVVLERALVYKAD